MKGPAVLVGISCIVVILYITYKIQVDKIQFVQFEGFASSNVNSSRVLQNQLVRWSEAGSDVAESFLLPWRFLRSYYFSQTSERRTALLGVTDKSNFATLYNVLVPEAYCPNLIRVGNVNDGGKWVCNPGAMPMKNCSIYSLGLREDISFDSGIQEFNNNSCNIYGYDLTPQTSATIIKYKQINGIAYQKKISTVTNESKNESTLGDLLLSHGDKSTEFLKMDIEGAEYATLVPFLKQHHVCQIFLEMHGRAHQMLRLLNEIASQDYLLFFYEINGIDLAACEYSFINKDCMEKYGIFELGRYLGDKWEKTKSTPKV